jgi:hypothetical protein
VGRLYHTVTCGAAGPFLWVLRCDEERSAQIDLTELDRTPRREDLPGARWAMMN